MPASRAEPPLRLRIGRRVVEITHPSRPMFPADRLTKADVARYYAAVAGAMLPHVRGRPLSLHRFRDGIGREGFFQQRFPGGPEWVTRAEAPLAGRRGAICRAVADDAPSLVYLANLGTIVFHCFTSRIPAIDRPDRLLFDLDPPDGGFEEAREAAFLVREELAALGLRGFPMTSGGKGLHVTVPLRPEAGHDTVRGVAHAIAERIVQAHPERLTLEQRLQGRGGRLYVDVTRNGYGQTAVAPYSLRARPGAPVATPLSWDELTDRGLRPDRFTPQTVLERLRRQGDAWRGLDRHRQSLARAARRLGGRA